MDEDEDDEEEDDDEGDESSSDEEVSLAFLRRVVPHRRVSHRTLSQLTRFSPTGRRQPGGNRPLRHSGRWKTYPRRQGRLHVGGRLGQGWPQERRR